MSKMYLLTRPLGDEVASHYGSYFTSRQISDIQTGDKLDVLCNDGLNYIVVVKEYDSEDDYGVLHFDKWSSKWDYKGPFANLYLARKGKYTEEISARNNYAHLADQLLDEQDNNNGNSHSNNSSNSNSSNSKDKQLHHQFHSGTKYPDDYFEKPRLTRRRGSNDIGVDREEEANFEQQQTIEDKATTTMPKLTLKLKSTKNNNSAGRNEVELSSESEDEIVDSSEEEEVEEEEEEFQTGRKRGRFLTLASRSSSSSKGRYNHNHENIKTGCTNNSGSSSYRNSSSNRISSSSINQSPDSSSLCSSDLSKLNNTALYKMGVADIASKPESNVSGAMALYSNHCLQMDKLRCQLDIDNSLAGSNRSLKLVKSILKNNISDIDRAIETDDNSYDKDDDDEEDDDVGDVSSNSNISVPSYAIIKYCQLKELLEAKKCIDAMIADIIK